MLLIGSQLRPAGTGGIKTTTWQKVNQAWKQTVRYKIKSFYIPPFQFLFAARLTQTHLQRTRLLTSFMSACPSTQALSQTFMVKLFDLIKKKKKISSLSLKIHCLKSLRGIFAHDNLPYKWPVRDSQQCVCQSVKGGGLWGWYQLVFPLQLFTEDEKKKTTLISLQSHE